MNRVLTGLLWTIVLTLSLPLLAQPTQQDTLKEVMRRLEVLTRVLEESRLGEVAQRQYQPTQGVGPAAAQVYYKKKSGVSIAGYGEVIYQNYASNTDAGNPSGKKDQIDYLRNIIYLGYKFNDRFLFNAEIEIEHAIVGEDGPGEVALEFGYIDALLSPSLTFRAGMILVPVGIINELHEPPTFYGVLRPETERNIIPTTWRSNGFGFLGNTEGGWSFRLYLMEGLNAAKFSSSGIRSARQSGGKAIAEDFALSGRVEYKALPGVTLGASFFTGNSGQGLKDSSGTEINARTTLAALHGIIQHKGLEIRALYALSSVDDVTRLNQTLGLSGSNSIGEQQMGYYATIAYDILRVLRPGSEGQLLPFVQYESYNTQEEVPEGFSTSAALKRTNLTIGLLYKPIPQIGFKVDYINRDNEAGTALDQWNVGVTYLF